MTRNRFFKSLFSIELGNIKLQKVAGGGGALNKSEIKLGKCKIKIHDYITFMTFRKK